MEYKTTYRAQELEEREASYYAIIPSEVRYDARLSSSEKLLFGELTALCNRSGYCWASNRYFAQLYGSSEKTIERQLRELEACGYIRREVLRDHRNTVVERRIFAGAFVVVPSPQKCGEGSPQNRPEASPQKCGEPPLKNVGSLKGLIIQDNNTPIIPMVMKRFTDYAGDDGELLQRLVDYAELRHKIRSPIKTDRQVTLLLNRLDNLSGGAAAVKRAMLDEATEKGWKTVYAPKADQPQRGQQQHRREEADPWK